MFVNSPKTWIEAEIYCLFEGGNLASVHSSMCYHGIQELTKYEYDFPLTWLGGQDFAKNCVWLWTDGSKFDYGNWYMDPSYYYMDREEHCLVMNYGLELKWHYANCSDTHPFVCVKNDWKNILLN
ncbi:ladderlectin [Cheilinus undulatus]|uniref:ladderlectin n=1 Tax=Cheilinus undulatus TaxID=241271 RepID=UPI001BD25078|nr:ladderlectin [Cheilinus undulatus]